ncbi:MAG: glycosyltransferase [Candidatus Kapabacteria bacterium]|nr:glycosyltransferase [Ignavibacteriota bacterium]MCW5883747.1 glycosyltransferase [Candidatus Kapabacteria bacterium]
MKNLLVIAYYFPPSGGPGVQRVLKHIKYLPEFGWNPIVLTVSNGDFPARDESLMQQIPENIKVIRTHIHEPYDIYRFFTGKSKDTAIDVNVIKKEGQKVTLTEKIAEFVRATFFIPDARIGWFFTAKKAIEELMKSENIDAVYSSSPPYTCSLIARYVKRKYKLPWVAGFRDPWTEFISSPKRWFIPRSIDKSMEFSVFNEADFIEAAWEGIIKDAIFKYPNLDSNKFHHVPNGFDSSDFPTVEAQVNSKFTVTYTGSMYGRRNPAALFEAVEKLISESKVDASKIKFRFIGRFGAEIHEMFEKATFKSNIEVISYMSHKESIENLMKSDCLLLVVDESKESEEIVPGKVYEYIGVGKPVIAVGPVSGAVGRLIHETEAGEIAHQTDIRKISQIYLKYYREFIGNGIVYKPKSSVISQFERRNSAKKLSELLNSSII